MFDDPAFGERFEASGMDVLDHFDLPPGVHQFSGQGLDEHPTLGRSIVIVTRLP
jgi:hypothetical protein